MSTLPNRLGQPWSDKEVKDLLAEVQKKKVPIELIADLHERTQAGIIGKLRTVAADYYFKKNLPLSEIQKITSLSTDQISDAIAKREIQAKWKEEKKKLKRENKEGKKGPIKSEVNPTDPVGDTKQIISLLKDIKVLLQALLSKS